MPVDMYSISQYLAQLLDIDAFDDLIPNGIQVEGTRKIQRMACAVTASQCAVDEAVKNGADLLLVHHGLLFKHECICIQGVLRNRLAPFFQSGLHLLAYHLPLDAHVEFGNTWPLARRIGLEQLEPFGRCHGKMIGVRGKFAVPLSGKKLYAILRDQWEKEGVYLGNDSSKEINTCAFVSGQGHKFLQEALDAGVDCFITGTVDDRTWHLVNETGIQFMAFGHYATERLGIQLLGQHLANYFGIEYFCIEEENPF
jgi:dinuclear metal center YbgI/SA1388 family protein